MNVTREQLLNQCKEAAVHLRKLKRVTPGIFPQYGRLMAAKRALKEAKEELKAAQEAWDAFGNHPSVRP